MPIFLHWNFLHIFFNMLAMMFFVSLAEKSYKIPTLATLFILSGIGGNLLSANCSRAGVISAGASTSLFGIIGTWISFLILNWKGLN